MSKFDKFQNGLEKAMTPIMNVISKSKSVEALTKGFMYTLPLTMGVVIITILVNLPIDIWQTFLNNTGLYQVGMDFASATLSLLALYIIIPIAYNYTTKEGENGVIGAVITLGAFLALMPMQTAEINGATVSVFQTTYMGSNGIFVALICTMVIPRFYCKLMKKNIKIKLPDAVPPMVTDSLSPTFVAIILFTSVFAVKYIFSLTAWGNIFDCITDTIGKPVMFFGSSPWSCILFFAFCNLLWFFGIHPTSITNMYFGIAIAPAMLANIEAFQAGEALPYLAIQVVYMAIYVGGNGNTLGLCLATLLAKSEKYKAMRKIVIIPNLFNINEPVIFGFPVVLNPIYFIPMVATGLVSGTIAVFLYPLLSIKFNPTISLPWATPGFISSFLQGGIGLLFIWLLSLFIHFLIYLPFFKIDDNRAYSEEQQNIEMSNAEL